MGKSQQSTPQTLNRTKERAPFQRLTSYPRFRDKAKVKLEALYLSLTPAQLKLDIESRLDMFCQTYEKKRRTQEVNPRGYISYDATTLS